MKNVKVWDLIGRIAVTLVAVMTLVTTVSVVFAIDYSFGFRTVIGGIGWLSVIFSNGIFEFLAILILAFDIGHLFFFAFPLGPILLAIILVLTVVGCVLHFKKRYRTAYLISLILRATDLLCALIVVIYTSFGSGFDLRFLPIFAIKAVIVAVLSVGLKRHWNDVSNKDDPSGRELYFMSDDLKGLNSGIK